MRSKELGKAPYWKPVVNRYRYDDNVSFVGNKSFNTAEGIQVHVNNACIAPLDVKNSLDSTLYLTGKRKLSDFIALTTPAQEYPRTYITYFADTYGWTDKISPETRCWYVEPSTKTQEQMERLGELPDFNFNTPYRELNQSMLFEVELLNDSLLRIGHWDGYKTTFLTSNDSALTVNFQFENDSPLNNANPQVFEYSLDSEISCINLYRKIAGYYYEFRYIPQYRQFAYALTTGHTYIPNTFKNSVSRADEQELILDESWVSYNTTLVQNDLSINGARTNPGLSHNYLLNTEFIYDDGPVNNFNIITLKNHLTNESSSSRNNPFKGSVDKLTLGENVAEDSSLFREYTSINVGTGDRAGYENIYLSYNDYTRELVFEADQITYFHMPPSMYPYDKLNVADAGLIECGAIAGDQPLKSDKIFKKRADYAPHSPWGNSSDEQSGTFLCSWLYWSGQDTESPMWLDRYYNPRKFTIHNALTAKPLVEFVTTFDNVTLENPEVLDQAVFDKKSDLCFEPESLYCYHHIGPMDVKQVIDNLSEYVTQKDLLSYRNSSDNEVVPDFQNNQPVYTFDSKHYGYTKTMADLAITNSYCINFNMYSDDWSAPFGHQLVGNYTNDGFGIFNKQLITPFYIGGTGNVSLFNTDYQSVLDFPVDSLITVKNPATENIFIYNDDDGGTLYEFNTTGVLEEQSRITLYDNSVYPPKIFKPHAFASDNNYLYLIHSIDSYFTVSLQDESVKEHKDQISRVYSFNRKRHSNDSLTSGPRHSIVSDGQVYTVYSHGKPIIDTDQNIWWLDQNIVYKYIPATKTYRNMFIANDSSTRLRYLLVDVDTSMYLIYHTGDNVNKLMKITDKQEIVYNVALSAYDEHYKTSTATHDINTNIVAEFNTAGYQQYISLLTDYVSTSTVVDIDTGEEVQVTENMSHETQIDTTTGEKIRSRVIPTPYVQIRNLQNDYSVLKNKYPETNTSNRLIFKTKIKNLYDRDQVDEIEASIDTKSFSPGWRNISYDFNTVTGKILIFVDGELVNTHTFTPMKYRYSDVSINRYTVGATPYYGGLPLGQFLNKPDTYMCTNMKIKQMYIYNKSLNYYDLKFLYRQLGNIQDIKWTIPGDNRSYLDEIQHVFAHKRPPMKSNIFNVNVLCDSIKDTALRQQLTKDLLKVIDQDSPVNSQVDNITWYETK